MSLVFQRSVRAAWAALACGSILLGGCSNDSADETGTGPGGGTAEPPSSSLPVPSVDTDLIIPNAEARGEVNGFLQANAQTAEAIALVLDPVPVSEYGEVSPGCWRHVEEDVVCTRTYTVCASGLEYTWEQRLDGSCGGSANHNDSVAAAGESSRDGTSGAFRVYAPNSSVVQRAYTWDADFDGGEWVVYSGSVSSANLSHVLEWSEEADGSQRLAREDEESARTVVTKNDLGNEGSAITDVWVRNSWVRKSQIVWFATGSGSLTVYDETDGSILREVEW